MAAKQVLHNFPVLRTTALLPRARASTTAISSVSAGPPPPMPPAMPQQWDFAMPPQEMPVRVVRVTTTGSPGGGQPSNVEG